MLTCLEKHEIRPPETASFLVAFIFQVSWLKSQLGKYPSALCTFLHLCLRLRCGVVVWCLTEEKPVSVYVKIACTWLCAGVSPSVPCPRQVPLRQVSEKLCCSAGISRNKCPQAGPGCKITVCEAFKSSCMLLGRL